MQFEDLLQPVSALLQDTLKLQPPPAQPAAAPAPAKQGKTTSTSGGKASTAAIAASAQPVPISLQLLMDPALCELPWEALPVVRRSCGSVARCLSLAQLQQLLVPPQTLLGLQQQQQQQAVVDAGAEAMQPVGWDVGKIGYLVDPLHHMSSTTERPGCYAAPLLPTFRYVTFCWCAMCNHPAVARLASMAAERGLQCWLAQTPGLKYAKTHHRAHVLWAACTGPDLGGVALSCTPAVTLLTCTSLTLNSAGSRFWTHGVRNGRALQGLTARCLVKSSCCGLWWAARACWCWHLDGSWGTWQHRWARQYCSRGRGDCSDRW